MANVNLSNGISVDDDSGLPCDSDLMDRRIGSNSQTPNGRSCQQDTEASQSTQNSDGTVPPRRRHNNPCK